MTERKSSPAEKEEPRTTPTLSKGARIGVVESMQEHRSRAELLLALAVKEKTPQEQFRYRVMATHFACAHAEVLLEALGTKQRKQNEESMEAACPELAVVQAVRAKDFHQMAIQGGVGVASYGLMTLGTNPGKDKQVVTKFGATGWQVASHRSGGTLKRRDYGHDVVQLNGQDILIGEVWKPLEVVVRTCLDSTEKWLNESVPGS